jgi:hypothetical protein
MIAFARFIVVTQQAMTLDYISQGILVFMTASPHRMRHTPDAQINERFAIELVPFAEKQFGYHS